MKTRYIKYYIFLKKKVQAHQATYILFALELDSWTYITKRILIIVVDWYFSRSRWIWALEKPTHAYIIISYNLKLYIYSKMFSIHHLLLNKCKIINKLKCLKNVLGGNIKKDKLRYLTWWGCQV